MPTAPVTHCYSLRSVLAFTVLLLIRTSVFASPAPPSTAEECGMNSGDTEWAQRVIDNWDVITTSILDLPAASLPWTVLYDAHCTWHIAAQPMLPEGTHPVHSTIVFRGKTVPIAATHHGEKVLLPNGREIPVQPQAFTSLYTRNGEKRPFFVLAMSSLWKARIPEAKRKFPLEGFFLGVAAHEMTHTLQLVAVEREIEKVQNEFDLPEDLSDSAPEKHFGDRPGYAEALHDETQLFLQAAAAEDMLSRRELARQALRMLHERRRRFFLLPDGSDGGWGRLEDLFLGLEGAAEWTHFRLAQMQDGIIFTPHAPNARNRSAVLAAMRQRASGEWVQDEGFPLFLLIDDFVPNWKHEAFSSNPPSPIAQLETALEDTQSHNGESSER